MMNDNEIRKIDRTKGIGWSYEMKTCGRCGGSGRYSWCQMHGDRCFKCHGKGKVLTSAGAKARDAVDAFRSALLAIETDEDIKGSLISFEWIDGRRFLGRVTDVRGDQVYITRKGKDYSAPRSSCLHALESFSDIRRLCEFVMTVRAGLTIKD